MICVSHTVWIDQTGEKCLTDFRCEKWWSEFIGQFNGPFGKSMHVFSICKWVANFQHRQTVDTHTHVSIVRSENSARFHYTIAVDSFLLTLRIFRKAYISINSLQHWMHSVAAGCMKKKFGNYTQSRKKRYELNQICQLSQLNILLVQSVQKRAITDDEWISVEFRIA